ncbi:MAG: hypothetical protein K9W43_03880 [Candidatus Thorarchaeota archaeon]|nr:hypothetical protein [Candidatus Thorarchaeota archaeon]
MYVSEDFVRTCGEVGNLTQRLTGTSIVDAFFGPPDLAPERQSKNSDPEDLAARMMTIADCARSEIDDSLRSLYLAGEAESLSVVCRWMGGADIDYADLVHDLFKIDVAPFDEKVISGLLSSLETLLEDHRGKSLREKVLLFQEEGSVSGDALKEMIQGPLQEKASEVGNLFARRVFSKIGQTVTDNGVSYEAVRGQPWSGYNYYQGNFHSINQFNIDRTFNKDSMMTVIYHEYEHHVSNLWREKSYRDYGSLELSIVPLHTGRCVISEGTADTARDFLGVDLDSPRTKIIDALYSLRRAVSINAAFLLNVEGVSRDEAASYIEENGLRTREQAASSLDFIAPTTTDGRPNLWAPYVFTYLIGRTQFVLPTWKRAVAKDEVPRFFKALYLNPFSGSSVTWNKAFDWLM